MAAEELLQRISELESKILSLEKRNEELVIELMNKSAEISESKEDTKKLRTAIEIHRDQTGHNICWLNDVRLWEALGNGKTEYPHITIPPKNEFLIGCRAYYDSRFENCAKDKK